MSATGIEITTTTNANANIKSANDDNERIETTTEETDFTQLVHNGAENSSFCHLASLGEQGVALPSEFEKNKVPLENLKQNWHHHDNTTDTLPTVSARDLNEFGKNLFNVDLDISETQQSPGLSLLQQTAAASSPPPQSYRQSRAYRHFKNPPQPHMCIRTTTETGEELFINVLSWTRIVIPQEPSDPIPLYGGMRVPPGSPRSPPIVFAVMANPEVLKDSGRHSKDPEERRAMVELMCDFVEAMNPGVKLVRNAMILKDRDISGELKDVWNAVQAQRDREREEQLLLQRQQHQQHFHNVTNASTNGILNSTPLLTSYASSTTSIQPIFSKSHCDGSESLATGVGETSCSSQKMIQEERKENAINKDGIEKQEQLENKISVVCEEQNFDKRRDKEQQHNSNKTLTSNALSNGNNCKNALDDSKNDTNNQLITNDCINDQKQQMLSNGSTKCSEVSKKAMKGQTIITATSIEIASPIPAETPPPVTVVPSPPTKKLGGFLPNGCIFPRFNKNNKHKDKDKEGKTKEKERNVLLSALKKSRDKKSNAVAAANQDEKYTSSNTNTNTANCFQLQTNNKQQQQICLQQLECGVHKLDLNHDVDANDSNSVTAKNTTSSRNSDGVGVH